MKVPAYIRKAIEAWQAWRTTQRLRAMPELRDIDRREADARRLHKAVRGIRAERRKAMHDELAREIGRGA